MKCKSCSSCRKGYFESKPDKYVCIGVKEPFVIEDINNECTEYPEKNRELNNKNNVHIKHISLNVSEEIRHILPDTLEKDLQDNEVICPVCHGLGVVLDNNIYGIKGDTSEAARKSMFPYNHQAIKFCPNCYNGVISLCEYCGKPLPRGILKCDCEQQRAKDEEEKRIKYQKTIAKANEVDINDLPKDTWFYDEQTDDYFSDIEGFVDSYKDYSEFENDKEMIANLPPVLWICGTTDISMDAGSIVEDACEQLHEDALESISYDDMKELQKLLDEWCAKQTGTRTIYPCYEEYVRVQKEWFG